ncbi:LuxR C-terminal-related transcriptional regulator [Cellulomonas sp. P22]|uniref:LuxR C-terminal-related transcriptional regulator n=1 Tax=Cellulomonas sp. P22 TaxID=3373189 RepID=UPI00379A76C9
MTEVPGGLPATAELDRVLLDTKLAVPRPRSGWVARAHLIERARTSGCRVVSVTAPAGYGKSTLLAEWALREDRYVAWVSLDRLDDDPAALLTLLAAAVERIPGGDLGLASELVGIGVSPLGRAAPRMAAVLRASSVPFLLVLDDLHEVRSAECHDILGVVLAGIPDGSQVVSASRTEHPHLPRLRATGDAIELTASDLALDASGAEQIFATSHVTVTPEAAALLTERTEGWPVGIYLASLIARDDASGAVPMLTGEDRYVADFLQREALMRLPEHTQQFLRRTAVLDQMCAPLCDALVDDPAAPRAVEELRNLEASSLFLIPLDRRREWFRYHPLFREFLLGELARIEPECSMKLHLRAADWFESHGSMARALEHLLRTSELERCVHLVTQLVVPTWAAGQVGTVQRWLRTLGDVSVAGYPPLAVLSGYIAVFTGNAVDAERWAAVVKASSFDLVPLDGSSSFDSARAMLRATMCADGPERMLADAAMSIELEPEWSPWRDNALLLLGEAHLLLGDVDRAASLLEEGSVAGDRIGNGDSVVFCEAELALLDMDHGRWTQAGIRVRRLLGVIDEHRMHDYAVSMLGFAAASRLYVHNGDIAEANRHLTRAMRARRLCTHVLPFVAVRGRVQLARTCAALGDHAAARHLLREIDDLLLLRAHLGTLLREVTDLRAALDASEHLGATGRSPLTPAELRVLPYLQTHLTIKEIGERLFVSRNTAGSEIGSIYRKLGVSTRSDAVVQAVRIGLLGD